MSTIDQKRGTGTSRAAQQSPVLPRLKREDFERVGKLGANIAMAVEALWANRLRSWLTTLGIFIGVAAVVATLLLTQGVSANITDTINSMGTNTITISPGTSNTKSGQTSSGSGQAAQGPPSQSTSTTPVTLSLTPADAKAVAKVSGIAQSSPVIAVNSRIVSGNQNWSTAVRGVNTSYQSIQNWTVENGAWFSSDEEQRASSVAVLGDTVYENLFASTGESPIGKTIRIDKQLYRVVGVLEKKGAGNSDDTIFVPYETALSRLKNNGYIDQILVQVDNADEINQVQDSITALLEQRHHIPRNEANDFTLSNSQELLQTVGQITSLLTILLVGISAISLTVGGIGIMNIMVVSVTERTREIGIRLSIGAQRQDVRNQFLIEALALSLFGGVIGMLVGMLVGYVINTLSGLPFVITATTLLIPFVISGAIGVIFGYYPAARASQLDPIEALRSL